LFSFLSIYLLENEFLDYLFDFCRGLLPPKVVVEDIGGTRTDAGMLGYGIYFADSARFGFASIIHCVSKKGATKLMAVTLSNLNGFSQFFYHWKEKEISNKTYVLFPTTFLKYKIFYLLNLGI